MKTVKRLRAQAHEMRRMVGLDMQLYAAFPRQYHRISPERSGWSLFFYLFVTMHMFPSVVLYRLQRFFYDSGLSRLATAVSRTNHIIYGVTIGHEVRSTGALLIAHGHVVLDGYTKLGHEVVINPFVTLGISNSDEHPFELWGPVIGDHVNIGTGAKIVGKVQIGDGAKIGANAVVVHDVPAYHTAVGVPAHSFPSTGPYPYRVGTD